MHRGDSTPVYARLGRAGQSRDARLLRAASTDDPDAPVRLSRLGNTRGVTPSARPRQLLLAGYGMLPTGLSSRHSPLTCSQWRS